MTTLKQQLQYLVFVLLNLLTGISCAEYLHKAIKIENSTHNTAVKSQHKIDTLSEKTQKMLDTYRSTTHKIETLNTYNQHLHNLLDSQKQEKKSLHQQLKEIETTQQEIIPLILRMLDSLDKFIALDLPFLTAERTKRLNKLKDMMVRADVTNAEKFRKILEAYQIENNYGNTIESYKAELSLDGVSSLVNFLRLGRVALYFQSFDGSKTGYWDRERKKWQTLPTDTKNAIADGLRMARKEVAPDLLILPIPTAESEK